MSMFNATRSNPRNPKGLLHGAATITTDHAEPLPPVRGFGTVYVHVIVRRTSAKARLVERVGGICGEVGAGRAVWLPDSQVHYDRECGVGGGFRNPTAAAPQCNFEVYVAAIPSWLYTKIYKDL